MLQPLEVILFAIAAGLVAYFLLVAIVAPCRVRLTNTQSADSVFEPCDAEDLAADMDHTIAALSDLGFIHRGHWRLVGHSLSASQMTLMEQPQTLVLAKVLFMAIRNRRHLTVLLQTRLEDGAEIATANNQFTVGLPPLASMTTIWLPEVHAPRILEQVHNQVCDILASGKRRLAIGDDPAAFLESSRERMLAHFVATGYYCLDEAHRAYRPTWKGAFLMTWRQLWPIRPLFRIWRRRSTRRLLRELGILVGVD